MLSFGWFGANILRLVCYVVSDSIRVNKVQLVQWDQKVKKEIKVIKDYKEFKVIVELEEKMENVDQKVTINYSLFILFLSRKPTIEV